MDRIGSVCGSGGGRGGVLDTMAVGPHKLGVVLGARCFCIYLFSLAPLSRLQAQAAHGGGTKRGVLGGLVEPGNRSWRVRTSGGLM